MHTGLPLATVSLSRRSVSLGCPDTVRQTLEGDGCSDSQKAPESEVPMATTGIATGTLWLLVSIPSGEPDPAETLGPLERCVGPLCDGEQWLPLVVPPVSKCETPVASGPLSECPLVSSGLVLAVLYPNFPKISIRAFLFISPWLFPA